MAKPVATAASIALPAPLQHIGADSRRDFFLRHDHAMFGDDRMNRAGGCRHVRAAALLLCAGREVIGENQHGCREYPGHRATGKDIKNSAAG